MDFLDKNMQSLPSQSSRYYKLMGYIRHSDTTMGVARSLSVNDATARDQQCSAFSLQSSKTPWLVFFDERCSTGSVLLGPQMDSTSHHRPSSRVYKGTPIELVAKCLADRLRSTAILRFNFLPLVRR